MAKRKTRKPTASERIATLEARIDALVKADATRAAATQKFWDNFVKLDTERQAALKKWADAVCDDLLKLFENDRTLAAAVDSHRHLLFPALLVLR